MSSTHSEIDFHGLPALALRAPDGATAIITLQGAQVVSWISADGREQLYLSERSSFAAGKPIRGGIPLVFPQFSTYGPLPRHGFARSVNWQVEERHAGSEFVGATLSLMDDEHTRAVWPHAFRAELTVSIARNRLDVEFSVTNIGETAFSFTAALHTYLRVAHVESCEVLGLQGCTYRDQTARGAQRIESEPAIAIEAQTDRIYLTAPADVQLRQPDGRMDLLATNFPDLVLWNPWVEGSAAIDDLPPDGFKRMLCIEPAVIEQPVKLAPGAEWWGRQGLICIT